MNSAKRWLITILALGMLLLLAGGTWFYSVQRQLSRHEAEKDLLAIAQLKVDQIVQWRSQRLGDANVMMQSPFFEGEAVSWLKDPTPQVTEDLLARFRSLCTYYHYSNVLLVDAEGEVRLSLHRQLTPLHQEAIWALAEALREQKPVFTELHVMPGGKDAHLGVIAPLFARNGAATAPRGALVLQCNVNQFLYPLIQSWPTPSRTAETLLVRRDGDDVLFLNELRHQEGTTLKLRIPVSRADLPAAMAVLGHEGVVQGKDYRGIDVLAALKAVPNSPWFMVAKVDSAEALAVLRRQSILILAVLMSLAAALATSVAVLWQQNDKAHYRALFEAEAARRRIEEGHRITLMSVGDAVITTDTKGRVELVNPVAEVLTGWRQDEARGMPLEEVFHIINEETRQSVENPVSRVLREQRVVGLANHTLLIARDGSERPVADSGAPVKNENDVVTGVVLVFRDRTKDRAAERSLRESEIRFRELFENAPLAYQSLDESGRFIEVNKAWLELLGYSRYEVMGKSFADFIQPDLLDRFNTNFPRFKETGEVFAVEYEMLRKDGEQISVSIDGKIGRNADGSFRQTHCTLTDITAAKESEKALREAHERLLTILNSIDAHIYVADMNTHDILFMNKCMQESFDRDLTGKKCWQMFRGETAPCSHCNNPQLIDAEGKPKDTLIWEDQNPLTGRWYINYDRAIEWVDARIVKLQVATDITKTKQMEKERDEFEKRLRQSQKLESIGTLAGGIAHDFNNILSAVLGYTELALEEVDKGTRLAKDLREVYRAGIRARDLVKQILAFARKREEELKPTKVSTIAKEALRLLRSTIPTSIELKQNIESDSLIMADPSQVHQIIMNLCTNASHAMEEEGGVLEVSLQDVKLGEAFVKSRPGLKAGNYLKLSAADTGTGIPPEIIESILEPYFTTKQPGEGTGLGLAMVHGIVKNYGGEITVESEVGKGSLFTVYLPIAEDGGQKEPYILETLSRGTERVLFIDDELPIAMLASQLLDRLGYRVTIQTNSIKALELFRANPDDFDLVVSDMTMPHMYGDRLAVELLKIRKDIPIILCTGYSKRISEERAAEYGVKALIMKPISRNVLAATIRKVLDEASGRG